MRERLMSLLWFTALPILVLQGVQACTPPSPPVTVMIGDSLGFGLRLNGFTPATVGVDGILDAAPGRELFGNVGSTADSGLGALRSALPRTGGNSWVVVELGTNDQMLYAADLWQPLIHVFLAAIPDDRCVGWVGTYRRDQELLAVFWDATVKAELANRKCHAFMDWGTHVRANQAAGGQDPLGPDGVHLTLAGMFVYADLIHQMWTTGHDVQ